MARVPVPPQLPAQNAMFMCEDSVTFKRSKSGGWCEWADFELQLVTQVEQQEGKKVLPGTSSEQQQDPQHENGIGGGASLVYPPEVVATIRQLYSGDIKDYPPRSGKRKNFYEVEFEELLEIYHEKELREMAKRVVESISASTLCNILSQSVLSIRGGRAGGYKTTGSLLCYAKRQMENVINLMADPYWELFRSSQQTKSLEQATLLQAYGNKESNPEHLKVFEGARDQYLVYLLDVGLNHVHPSEKEIGAMTEPDFNAWLKTCLQEQH
ncbi:hypothetical protein ACROYT_G014362 [Oculina patagonica]